MWKANLQRLQREISVISRVVVHPKYRSIGLGARLVGETLAQAGTPCVEAVAVMAKYNPFFGRAGMRKIAESKPSVHVAAALERLGELGFDSALLADVVYGKRVVSEVGREAVLDVFEELSRCDAGVRRRLECLHSVYPRHEEFMAKAADSKSYFCIPMKHLVMVNITLQLLYISQMPQKNPYLITQTYILHTMEKTTIMPKQHNFTGELVTYRQNWKILPSI